MTISTARASYQPKANINLNGTGKRQPFACPAYRQTLREIAHEATKASDATTQAAYLLRLNGLRSLLKSLG